MNHSKPHTVLKILILLLAATVLFGGFFRSNRPVQDTRTKIKTEYQELRKKFDPDYPGRGTLDYANRPIGDNPKSYAMFLSAELMEFSSTNSKPDLVSARKAGVWLLDNSDLDHDGQMGWGIPVEWDAFGDNTINPPNTVYTISTAIVVNSLLDWLEFDPDAPTNRIISTIDNALQPFLDQRIITTEGLLPYSLNPNDAQYETFNPAAYFAGQMQRYSHYVKDGESRKKVRETSDRIMLSLLRNKKIDSTGGWYWYYDKNDGLNSLAHAGYIVDGIRNYIKYKGRLSDQFNWVDVYKHLETFRSLDSNEFLLMPILPESESAGPTRLYGLGMYMYLEGVCGQNSQRIADLFDFSRTYETSSGFYTIKPESDVVINEYNSYLLYGWSSILSNFGHQTCLNPKKETPIISNFEPVDFSQPFEVPFTFFNTKTHSVRFIFDMNKLSGELRVDEQFPIPLPEKVIPLKVIETKDNQFVVFTRELLTSQIRCWALSLQTKDWSAIPLPDKLGFNLFRQAAAYNNQILLVAYDPELHENHLFRIVIKSNEILFDNNFNEKFPILALYPHQPHILTAESNGILFFGSGSSIFKYSSKPDGQKPKLEFWNIEKNNRMLELASNENGVFALYKNQEFTIKNSDVKPFFIYDVIHKQVIKDDFDGGIPYNLHLVGSNPKFSKVEEPGDLVNLFLQDMRNMPASGIMNAGINNLEGEVVWSQSYYLQGFIDLLSDTPDRDMNTALQSIKPDIKKRLDFEIALIDKLLSDGTGLYCKAFTTDRTPVLHIVQTGKTLLLLKRYRQLENSLQLTQYDGFRKHVIELNDHIEILTKADENTPPLTNGRYYIKWPKGVSFWADGSGVPYNHQNCWAAGVMFNEKPGDLDQITLQATNDISQQVLDYEGFRDPNPKYDPRNSDNPLYYEWYYWWGIGKDGWNESQQISINTPTWRGDGENIARPVYRSFDAIAILVGGIQNNSVSPDLLNYFVKAVENDGLELFIIPYLNLYNRSPEINKDLAIKYIRADEQPDFRNSFWAYKALYKHLIKN